MAGKPAFFEMFFVVDDVDAAVPVLELGRRGDRHGRRWRREQQFKGASCSAADDQGSSSGLHGRP